MRDERRMVNALDRLVAGGQALLLVLLARTPLAGPAPHLHHVVGAVRRGQQRLQLLQAHQPGAWDTLVRPSVQQSTKQAGCNQSSHLHLVPPGAGCFRVRLIAQAKQIHGSQQLGTPQASECPSAPRAGPLRGAGGT